MGVPTHDQDNPESLLSEKPFWHLINLVAVDAGILDFGAQIALITLWHQFESLAPLINNSSNLENLLVPFCDIASSQSSQVSFVFEQEPGLWFIYNGVALIKIDIQMELYRITSIIQLVQLAAGSGWYPEQIQLQMPTTKRAGLGVYQQKDTINSINADFVETLRHIIGIYISN